MERLARKLFLVILVMNYKTMGEAQVRLQMPSNTCKTKDLETNEPMCNLLALNSCEIFVNGTWDISNKMILTRYASHRSGQPLLIWP